MLTFVLFRKNRRQAFTLTEAAIVLGVVGIVLAAIWGAASTVSRNKSVNRTVEYQAMIVQNMRSLYKSRPLQTGTTNFTELMMKAEIFPTAMIAAGNPLPQTVWDTDVTIIPVSTTTFRISYPATLPTEVCIQLVARSAGSGRDRGLTAAVADGNTYDTPALLNTLSPATIPACIAASFVYNIQG